VVDERHRRDGEAGPEADVDRAAILARRRRFILMALGGLSGVGGCRHVEPPPSPLEPIEATSHRPPHEQVRLSPPPALVPIDPPTLRPISDEELRTILEDPDWDPCDDNPFGSDESSETRVEHEEQKTKLAKVLHERAKRAQAEGDLVCALELFEAAYYQVPGKHRMALHVGELAATLGDCDKARDFLEHFVRYADYEKYHVELERAQALLDTPELRSCERPTMPSDGAEPVPCLSMGWDDPEPTEPSPPASKRQRRAQERANKKLRRG
jgi:hypothetical protein